MKGQVATRVAVGLTHPVCELCFRTPPWLHVYASPDEYMLLPVAQDIEADYYSGLEIVH